MKTSTKQLSYIVLIIVTYLINGCSDSENNEAEPSFSPIQLLENGDIINNEKGWSFMPANQNAGDLPDYYINEISEDKALSPGTKSLKISADEYGEVGQFAYWSQQIKISSDTIDLQTNPILVLKGSVLVEGVEGRGISIAMEAIGKSTYIFKTTQDMVTINGDADNFTEYTIKMSYAEDVNTINVYLVMLNKTIGTVYFDNISLTLKEKKQNQQ